MKASCYERPQLFSLCRIYLRETDLKEVSSNETRRLISTLDQHTETQLYDLHEMAKQRGYQIVEEYEDRISGAKARRPGLDAMMRDARCGQFDVAYSGLPTGSPGQRNTSSRCWTN